MIAMNVVLQWVMVAVLYLVAMPAAYLVCILVLGRLLDGMARRKK